MWFILLPSVTFERLVHCSKARSPIVITPLPIFTLPIFVWAKAHSLISTTLSGIVRFNMFLFL